jgi:hypothetical protein
MCKDGHLVSEEQQYLRSRNMKSKTLKPMVIYNDFYQIRGANDDFNEDGKVTLRVEILNF